VYIDKLPEGAAIDHKTLAKAIAGYGQIAVRRALDVLVKFGHLRRIKAQLVTEGGTRWVTRTYFSRSVKPAAWWAQYARNVRAGDAADAPQHGPACSAAYRTLVHTRVTDARMTLSKAECDELEPLAAEWLARGAGPTDVVRALTSGLPQQVHSAGALARRRLESKMPPKKIQEREVVLQSVLVCMYCDTSDATVEKTGVCAECTAKAEIETEEVPATLRAAKAATRTDALRVAAGLKPKGRG
jgi:hypothetical protein